MPEQPKSLPFLHASHHASAVYGREMENKHFLLWQQTNT